MNQLPILLRREFQEQRGTFLYLPAAIAAFAIVLMLSGLVMVTVMGEDAISISLTHDGWEGEVVEERQVFLGAYWGDRLEDLARMSEPRRERALEAVYLSASAPLVITMWFVALFYLVGCLFDDRRDRSILFWKSMPVSDLMTIGSKLMSALVVLPLLYLVFVVFVHVMLLLTSTVSALGTDIGIWETLWEPANLFSRWARMFALGMMGAVWCLPFVCWTIFVSSWAKSVPLVWTFGIPIAVGIADWLLLPGSYISHWIANRFVPFGSHGDEPLAVGEAFEMLMSIETLVGLIVAGTFFYGAVIMRGRADEI
jgi:ABC-2 type transport system permease protein